MNYSSLSQLKCNNYNVITSACSVGGGLSPQSEVAPDFTHLTSGRPPSQIRCVHAGPVSQSSFSVKRLKGGESESDPVCFHARVGSITSGRLSVTGPPSAVWHRRDLLSGFPSFLLPSDGPGLAGPRRSLRCTRSFNAIVGKRLARAVRARMNGCVGEFPLWLARLL